MASTRVRGFAPWQPRQETRATLDQVKQVLTQYRQLWPLTARQVFYRLVGAFDFPKTENAYKRLLEYLNRGRRAGLIPWGAIRDDGSTVVGSDRYEDAESFLSTVRDWASRAPMDLLQHQPIHLELFCEAAGMVPQLDRVARTYGVPVRSSGGFDSTTVKHDLAVIYSQIDKPVRVLHVGDLDPSGEHLHNALGEDLNAFMEQLGGRCTVRRVAVTPEHQQHYGLATAPPKASDKRSFDHDFTVQAEALDPTDLASIVRDAIEEELDLEIHQEALVWQERVQAELSAALSA